MPQNDPLQAFVRHQGMAILDGGLATALEQAGQDLNDPLWSAKVLLEAPDVVQNVHRSFLEAGADCISSATYQATVPGFGARGMTRLESLALVETGVQIAVSARNNFWSLLRQDPGRLRPIVAASLGPYGAYLADGSEYRGDYGAGWDVDRLCAFHEARWNVLAQSEADIVACETIPSGMEVEALLRLVRRTPGVAAWISLSCRDGETLVDGTPLQDVARACDAVPGVIAVGVNCVPPDRVAALLKTLARGTAKPRIAYPNSGERFDTVDKSWGPDGRPGRWVDYAEAWQAEGAKAVGGCCRTTPADIARLRRLLPRPNA